jgi:hypothetical protein
MNRRQSIVYKDLDPCATPPESEPEDATIIVVWQARRFVSDIIDVIVITITKPLISGYNTVEKTFA